MSIAITCKLNHCSLDVINKAHYPNKFPTSYAVLGMYNPEKCALIAEIKRQNLKSYKKQIGFNLHSCHIEKFAAMSYKTSYCTFYMLKKSKTQISSQPLMQSWVKLYN